MIADLLQDLTSEVFIQNFGRLCLAALFGGIVGLERERLNRVAGLRTHVLVSLGAAIFTLLSVEAFTGGGPRDPARVAAQVVSGVGFLGAGTIMKEGGNIRGLTTAASLWVTAAIGMSVGVGFVKEAFVTTVLVVVSLLLLKRLEFLYAPTEHRVLELTMPSQGHPLRKVYDVFSLFNTEIIRFESSAEGDMVHYKFELKLDKDLAPGPFLEQLRESGATFIEF